MGGMPVGEARHMEPDHLNSDKVLFTLGKLLHLIFSRREFSNK